MLAIIRGELMLAIIRGCCRGTSIRSLLVPLLFVVQAVDGVWISSSVTLLLVVVVVLLLLLLLLLLTGGTTSVG